MYVLAFSIPANADLNKYFTFDPWLIFGLLPLCHTNHMGHSPSTIRCLNFNQKTKIYTN